MGDSGMAEGEASNIVDKSKQEGRLWTPRVVRSSFRAVPFFSFDIVARDVRR